MTNTVTVVNQPSTTHAATIKVFTPSSFKERSTAVAPNGTITSQFVYNSGVLTTDTVVTVQSAKNADGTLHNTLSIITDRVVADGSGTILETKPIKAVSIGNPQILMRMLKLLLISSGPYLDSLGSSQLMALRISGWSRPLCVISRVLPWASVSRIYSDPRSHDEVPHFGRALLRELWLWH